MQPKDKVMLIRAINVGRPKPVPHKNDTVDTGIFKIPVAGRVAVNETNLEGDGQADLVNHGGWDKAVYAYDISGYEWWMTKSPNLFERNVDGWDAAAGSRNVTNPEAAPPFAGLFGENLTVSGLPEDEVCIGDIYRTGSAEFQVTQPRVPCFKLGIRVSDPTFVKEFLEGRRTGFYLRVLQPGEIGPGDAIELVSRHEGAVTIRDLVEAYFFKGPLQLVEQALSTPGLSKHWTARLEKRLAGAE